MWQKGLQGTFMLKCGGNSFIPVSKSMIFDKPQVQEIDFLFTFYERGQITFTEAKNQRGWVVKI